MATPSPEIPQQSPAIVEYADIEFEVEGKTVGANKASLCMVSPVFKTMLEGKFKEAGLSKIPLPEKSYDAFVYFIEITHLHKNITSNNVYDVLPIMHEYGCKMLLKKCEAVLMNEPVSLKLYYLADIYGFKKLYSKSLKDLQGTNYFKVRKKYPNAYKSLNDRAKIDYLEAMLESLETKQWKLWND